MMQQEFVIGVLLLLTSENDIDRQLQKGRFESNNATALQGLSHGQDLHRRELQGCVNASVIVVSTPYISRYIMLRQIAGDHHLEISTLAKRCKTIHISDFNI